VDPDFWNAWGTSAENISSDVGSATASDLTNDTWGTTWDSGSGSW
jgi:hypothetical protein